MLDAFRRILGDDSRIAYALVFGSSARGPVNVHSDADVALGLARGVRLTTRELGELASRLEEAAGRPVDLVLLEDAPPGLAYRIFRDGVPIVERDRPAFVERKARAVLEYLDFRPIEELCTRRVLDAAVHGR